MPLVTLSPPAGCCGEAAGATASAAIGRQPCCAEASESTGPAFDAVLRDAAEVRKATTQRRDAGAAAAASLTAAEASTPARLITRAATTEA